MPIGSVRQSSSFSVSILNTQNAAPRGRVARRSGRRRPGPSRPAAAGGRAEQCRPELGRATAWHSSPGCGKVPVSSSDDRIRIRHVGFCPGRAPLCSHGMTTHNRPFRGRPMFRRHPRLIRSERAGSWCAHVATATVSEINPTPPNWNNPGQISSHGRPRSDCSGSRFRAPIFAAVAYRPGSTAAARPGGVRLLVTTLLHNRLPGRLVRIVSQSLRGQHHDSI